MVEKGRKATGCRAGVPPSKPVLFRARLRNLSRVGSKVPPATHPQVEENLKSVGKGLTRLLGQQKLSSSVGSVPHEARMLRVQSAIHVRRLSGRTARIALKQKVGRDKRGEGGSDGLVPTQLEVAQGGGTLRLVLHFQWQVRRGSHNATALRARPPAAAPPHTCVEIVYLRAHTYTCTCVF